MIQEVDLQIIDERLYEWGLPRYMSDWSAGLDLYACLDSSLTINPSSSAILISTGIAIGMKNPDMAAVILPRSGLGHKKGLILGNSVGLIDADYTATIMVSAWNRNVSGDSILIHPGDRIAQLVFLPIVRVSFKQVPEINMSKRGAGGFGSTGVSWEEKNVLGSIKSL